MKPVVVDDLGLFHESLDTVDGVVVIGLVIVSSLADRLVVEHVHLLLIVEVVLVLLVISLVDEDKSVKLLDLDVPRVV